MTGLHEYQNFKLDVNLSTFSGLKIPVLNFLNFLSNRALLSHKSLSFKKRVLLVFYGQ